MNETTAPWDALERRVTASSSWVLVLGALVSIAAASAVALAQTSWIGRGFPGFLVLPNRVIASVGRASWSGTRDGGLFQHVVVAVDAAPVATNGEVYRLAAAGGVRPITYSVRDGATTAVVPIAGQIFSGGDYLALFGSYAATGLLYLFVGLLAAALLPGAQGLTLLVLGGIGGIYALSGAAIYGAGASLRLHAFAEAAFSGALLQAALLLPRPWRHPVAPWIALGWFASCALAIAYQLVLHEPSAYSAMHACAEVMLGASGLLLATRLVWELASAMRQAGPLLRWSSFGAAVGLGVPAVVVGVSGLTGGEVPVNYVTAAAFAFPLCTCVGLLRERSGLSPAT